MKAESTVPASLRDELDEAEQREQLAYWVEAARKVLYDLEWAFKNFPELRKHPGLSEIGFPDGWNESMSNALQMMHIENSGVLLRVGEMLDELSAQQAPNRLLKNHPEKRRLALALWAARQPSRDVEFRA